MGKSKAQEVACSAPLLDNMNTIAESIRIERLKENPVKNKIFYIKDCESTLEIKQFGKKPECRILNLTKDYCINIRTGEVKEKIKRKNRSQNYESLRRTMNNLRDLINCNVTDNNKCLWITLTYNQNNGIVRDTKKVYKDHKNFWERCCTYFNNYNITIPKYINVLEPQRSGAWHMHLIWIFDQIAPFIPNEKIAELWGHGFTKTQKLKDTDNIANYVCAYLCDYVHIDKNSNKKMIIKNARLYLYPNGVRYYRHSRNIKRPIKTTINSKEEYEDLTKDLLKIYESNVNIYSLNELVQSVHKEQFKKKK